MRALFGVAVMTVAAASPAFSPCINAADDWMNLGTVSMTDAITPKLSNRSICYSDGKDIACDNTNLYIQTGGLINAGSPANLWLRVCRHHPHLRHRQDLKHPVRGCH